ncbi:MAG: transglycosylase SLT domain-containing protein [Janthinobacterium lividum]
MAPLILEDKVSTNRAAFVTRVRDIANKLGCDPNWLMGTMYLESGLLPTAKNPNGGATGLIQFMPKTAQGLGTTTAALEKMSNVQQLDYVYAYLKPWTGKFKSWFDLYLCIFYPAAIGQPDSYVLGNTPAMIALIAKQNAGFDVNHDGQITKGEFRASYLKRLPAAYQSYLATEKKSA